MKLKFMNNLFRRLNGTRRVNRISFLVKQEKENKIGIPYVYLSVSVFMLGLSFAFVPLYQLFCQSTGYGGTIQENVDLSKLLKKKLKLNNEKENEHEETKKSRLIEINFTSQSNMPWTFEPEQKSIIVKPGETVLAFYKVKNLLNRPIIGIALYHVLPDEAGLYFNKIQCFCFEEQLLNANEELDLPVLFFIDPDILKDPRLKNLQKITLSYIFFESDSEIPPEYQHLTNAVMSNKKTTIKL